MSKSKLKLIALTVALVMVLSALPSKESPIVVQEMVVLEQMTPADEVWSYDFDDGNLSDWEIYGIEGTIPYSNPPGNFSTDDGSLRADSTGTVSSLAHVNSSVAYGTWSFDVDVVDTYNHEIVILFIIVSWNLDAWGIDCYYFQIVTGMYNNDAQPRVQAGRAVEADNRLGKTVTKLDEEPIDDILGWKSFIITREGNGQFYFYMNGDLVLSFKDAQHTTCNQFAFGTGGGPAIDNINVSNTVDYDAAPPEWVQEPTDQIIDLGVDFGYDLNATDFSGLGTWAINDTSNYAIDSNGVITNAVDLALGTYGLNVSVSDTLGNLKSAEFVVTVTAVPPVVDLALIGIAGVGVIVVVALVVLFMKKRG